jgi:hypothetical protein
LAAGQRYHWTKKYVSLLEQEENPQRRDRLLTTTQQFHYLLAEIEKCIVEYANDLTSIKDKDILEAIKLLKETYRTEEKGLIYERSSSNPLAQSLFKELRDLLERRRTELANDGVSLTVSNLLDCCEVLDVDISYHLASKTEKAAFLNFIARNHPEAAGKKNQRGIIIAG